MKYFVSKSIKLIRNQLYSPLKEYHHQSCSSYCTSFYNHCRKTVINTLIIIKMEIKENNFSLLNFNVILNECAECRMLCIQMCPFHLLKTNMTYNNKCKNSKVHSHNFTNFTPN